MKIGTIFSGSKGNCSLLRLDNANILIDCGVGYAHTAHALREKGVSPADISAIFVTHTHSDHIAGIEEFLKKHPDVITFVHKDSRLDFERRTKSQGAYFDRPFDFAGTSVSFAQCYHDAPFCNAYRFEREDESICFVTDTGCFDDQLFALASQVRTLVIESNHDTNMLLRGNYPFSLKQRIRSDCGHLSNFQTGQILEKLLPQGIKNVLLAHLSEQNNRADLALDSAKRAIEKCQIKVNLFAAQQWEASPEL